jgi:hypothetical protein
MYRFVKILLAIVLCALSAVAQQPAIALTNKDVQDLVKAGVSIDIIIAKIETSPSRFDTSPDHLTALKAAGIPDSIVLAMVLAPAPGTDAVESAGPSNDADPVVTSQAVTEERARRDAACPSCKFLLIANIDAQTGVVRDDWATKNQHDWLKDHYQDVAKGKTPRRFLLTTHRENADYVLVWTQAQGFRPYVTYVPRTETLTARNSGTISTFGESGSNFGMFNGTVQVNRTYYEAQIDQHSYLDVALSVFDRTGKKIYETWHQGNWAWSKPDEDVLEDAFNYLARLPVDRPLDPGSEGGTIWLYRTKSLTDSMLNPTIYSGGEPIAKLEKGQFLSLRLPPGVHYFSWTDKPKRGEEASITVTPGSKTFLKVRYRKIEPIDSKDAAKQFRDLKAIDSKNVLSQRVEAKTPSF